MDMCRLFSLVAEKVKAKSAYPQHGWHEEVYSIFEELAAVTRREALPGKYLAAIPQDLSGRAPFAGRASCRGCLPDERIVKCRSAHTISRCCTRDRSRPSCSPRAVCLDSHVAGNTSELIPLRKYRGTALLHDNATDTVSLRRCCPETN